MLTAPAKDPTALGDADVSRSAVCIRSQLDDLFGAWFRSRDLRVMGPEGYGP